MNRGVPVGVWGQLPIIVLTVITRKYTRRGSAEAVSVVIRQ